MKTMLALLATAILVFCAAATAAATVVKDIGGRSVRAGTNYYILPVSHGLGGGLTLAPRNNISCPLYVAQERHDVNKGLPLKFHPVDPKDTIAQTSSDLNVVFDAATVCVQSTAWRLVLDDATGQRYVGTGGTVGNPGIKTVSNWFKIEEYDKDYKLAFCPSVCNTCKVVCGDVGVFMEGGTRYLGLSATPSRVVFKKA